MVSSRGWSLTVCACLAACADPVPADGLTDDERTVELAARIAEDASWTSPAGWEGRQYHSDGSPHGPWVEIRVNALAADALDGRVPPDGILTKRMSDARDGDLGPVVFAAWRVEHYAPERGDWFFAQWIDGEVQVAGSPDGCWNCHSSGADAGRAVTGSPGTPPP